LRKSYLFSSKVVGLAGFEQGSRARALIKRRNLLAGAHVRILIVPRNRV
jgi:hypothetical protein